MPLISTFGAGSAKGFGQARGGAPQYIVASGGTITYSGDYAIHTFLGSGSFEVESIGDLSNSKVDYLVVAGGGGPAPSGGHGGGGGFRESQLSATSGTYTASPLATPVSLDVTETTYPVTVGAGGVNPGGLTTPGTQGGSSVFNGITSAGGGGSGVGHYSQPVKGSPGLPGGSGGGSGGYPAGNVPGTGGTGNTPPTSPPQGNPGGKWASGGAISAGSNPGGNYPNSTAGNGAGTQINPTGTIGGDGPNGTLRYFSAGQGTQPGEGGNAVANGGTSSYSGNVQIRYRTK